MEILPYLHPRVDILVCLEGRHQCALTVMGAFIILKVIRFGYGLLPLEVVMRRA